MQSLPSYLKESPMKRNERVSKIMTRDPHTANITTSIFDVQKLMVDHHFHHVPVVSGKKLVGMISATDLARATYEFADGSTKQAVLDGTRTVQDVMQAGLVTLKETDTVRTAAETLAKDWFHSLPVVDDEQNLVGIVTTTDLLNYLVDQF